MGGKVTAARRKLSKVKSLSANILGKLKRCRKNSFTAGTPVLMTDGTRKPIEDVQLGDQVLATDPETGETTEREVVATIVGTGVKELVGITVDTDGDAGNATGTVVATAGHPFWVSEQARLVNPVEADALDVGARWSIAADLDAGDALRTSDDQQVRVVAADDYTAIQTVHNLTISDVHTYHVGIGQVETLVHNAGGCVVQPPDDLPGFPKAKNAKAKTPVQGGGGKRKRWKDDKGNIYEWDSRHGEVEKYNKRDRHQGSFDPNTGNAIKPRVPGRSVEP